MVRQGKLGRTIQKAVVYDLVTGQILHVHQHVALEGGFVPDHEQVEKKALEYAMVRQGRDLGRMRVLHIALDAIKPGKIYRVDVGSLTLVEIGSQPVPGMRRPR